MNPRIGDVRSVLAQIAQKESGNDTDGTFENALMERACISEQVVSPTAEVLSLASHELKNPLANIIGFVDMILRDWERSGPPNEKQSRQLKAVHRNGFRMDPLVNNILTMAKIESSDEMYEGDVKLEVKNKGAVKESIRFVDALRQNPQIRLLRMVSNSRRDGMEVWIRLRSPNPLRTTLLAFAVVNRVEAAECSESDPRKAVLRVSLD